MGLMFYIWTGRWFRRKPRPLPQGSLSVRHTAELVRDTQTNVGTAEMVRRRMETWALQKKKIKQH